MAIRWYKPVAGPGLNLFIDPQSFTQTEDQEALALVQEIEASNELVRTELGVCRGFSSLQEYDDYLEDQRWQLQDRLDYYNYDNRTEQLDVRDGAWFSPDAVELVCGEDAGDVAADSIDGDTGTFWRHSAIERHSIIYRLRDYPKKVSKMRIWHAATGTNREQLQNIDVFASRALGNIDDPANQLLAGFTPPWSATGDWNVIDFTFKKNKARYVKLLFDSNRPDGQIQIREIEIRVETRDP